MLVLYLKEISLAIGSEKKSRLRARDVDSALSTFESSNFAIRPVLHPED